jgi:hypothetical protein
MWDCQSRYPLAYDLIPGGCIVSIPAFFDPKGVWLVPHFRHDGVNCAIKSR